MDRDILSAIEHAFAMVGATPGRASTFLESLQKQGYIISRADAVSVDANAKFVDEPSVL